MQEVSRIGLPGRAVSLEVHDDSTATTGAQSSDTCYVISTSERRVLQAVKVRSGAGPDPALLLRATGCATVQSEPAESDTGDS